MTLPHSDYDCEVRMALVRETSRYPTQPSELEAGWDLYVDEEVVVPVGVWVKVPAGVRMELPPGWEGQVRPRSSTGPGRNLHVQFGTVDCTYRGELSVVVCALWKTAHLKVGERVAQLVFARVPRVLILPAQQLSDSSRGTGGFGSSGR